MPAIAALLSARGVQLDGPGLDLALARDRSALTMLIGENYQAFEIVRKIVLGQRVGSDPGPVVRPLLAAIVENHVAYLDGDVWAVSSANARYLRGGWLEEYAALAALSAGADEVRAGQVLRWVSGPYGGVNEVDVIARFGERLVFASCKALWSQFDKREELQREQLTNALHEADNTLDHFGGVDDRTALIVSTDLYDECQDLPRYRQLFGKAHALAVDLITLEDFAFDDLVRRFRMMA